jgi:hypothetical protein
MAPPIVPAAPVTKCPPTVPAEEDCATIKFAESSWLAMAAAESQFTFCCVVLLLTTNNYITNKLK